MDSTKKIILDLCGGTGSWSRPYAERPNEYEIHNITLPDYDVTNTAFGKDEYFHRDHSSICFSACNKPEKYIYAPDVYGILAAPPCTEFSVAKGNRPRDLESAMKVVEACIQIIWHCRLFGNLRFWALENPGRNGLLRQFLGIPPWEFEQWQFGGTIEKPTCVWGLFNLPKPTVTEKPFIDKFRNKVDNRNLNSREYANPICPDEYKDYISQFKNYTERRGALRAITPAGFAEAFFRANK